MAKKKQKQKEPEHAPRDYLYIRLWAGYQNLSAEAQIDAQAMAAEERQPLDVVFYDTGAQRWFTVDEIKTPDARKALGLPALFLACPECGGDTVTCTACGAVYQIRRGLGLCEQKSCLATTGALECGYASCRKIVSFSGDGVIHTDTSGDKELLTLRPWVENTAGDPGEAC